MGACVTCVYLRKAEGLLCESILVAQKSRLFPQTQVSKSSIARKEQLALCMGPDLLKRC